MIPYLDLGATYRELEAHLAAAARKVLESGRYVLGPQVEAFEREFAEYCGARACVGVGNGLDAIRLMLTAFNVGAGAEVIVPSNTYIATWLGVSLAGATPVPVEPDEASYNLDPARVELAITPRTRAILAVNLYGRAAELGELAAIADRRGLRLLVDAAQAHGSRLAGSRRAALGDAAAFSFYPGKNLGAYGDAGAVVTDNEFVAARIRRLRNYGETQKYVNDERGINSRLDELQAALLRIRLQSLDAWNRRRQRIAERYLAGLAGLELELPLPDPGGVWHVFPLRSKRRFALRRALERRDIQTLVHYPIPPHLQFAYAHLRFSNGDFPIAERIADEEISLPIGPHLSDAQVGEVIAAIQAAVK
jgi:dTDP-4-amino-4,6-dideoxygalactose transaminase